MADPETGQEQGERTWIERQNIKSIRGALKPGAYVARAYHYGREHDGQTPPWARKTSAGQWLFDLGYIRADAVDNLKYLSVSEAARMLGATRRAVQNWVDDGVIPSDQGEQRDKGSVRRILRQPFLEMQEELKQRLQAPAVVGFKKSRERRARIPEDVPTEARKRTGSKPKTGKMERAAAAPLGEAARKAQVALALEKQLREARELKIREKQLEHKAEQIAERILADMFDGVLNRHSAMDLYNKTAKREKIPDEIRVRVRKRLFGK